MKEFIKNESKNKKKFESLKNVIFGDLKRQEIPKENLSVVIFSNPFYNDYITDCQSRSTLYPDKIVALDSIFWNEKTFKTINKKIKKNLFPIVKFGSGKFINERLSNEMYFSFVKTFPKFYGNNNLDYFYFYPKNKNTDFSKIMINEKSNIYINFESYEKENLVIVEINFYEKGQLNQISKNYYFIENQWKLTKCTIIVGGNKTNC